MLVTDTVGFVRKLPHELVEAFRSTLDSVRLADLVLHVVDGTAADAGMQMAAVHEVLREIGADGVPELVVVNKADRAPEEAKALAHGMEGSVLVSALTGEGVDELLRVVADRLRGADRVVELVVPWARGDVLAAVHREGEVVGQTRRRGVGGAPGRARRRRPGPLRGVPVRAVTFRLPPYPYDRLDGLAEVAAAHPGGMVDCSVGTPCDPPPPAVVEALATSDTERGYPDLGRQRRRCARRRRPGWPAASASSWRPRRSPSRSARRSWWRRCRTSCDCASPSATPSSTPRCRTRPMPWGRSWPGAVPFPSPRRPAERAGSTWPRSTPTTRRAPSCCGPTRLRTRPAAWATSARRPSGGGPTAIPVFSDECYTEFTWAGPPRSVLEHGPEGVVAVHSLSKRSNLAGLRVGFYAGDAELVEFLRAVRQHAGLMVPGPVQAAAVAALADDDHVVEQRVRYGERLEYLAAVLGEYGCPCELPEGGFYLWVPVPEARHGATPGPWPSPWPPTAASWSPRRPLRRARGPPRAGRGGPADGTPAAGGAPARWGPGALGRVSHG